MHTLNFCLVAAITTFCQYIDLISCMPVYTRPSYVKAWLIDLILMYISPHMPLSFCFVVTSNVMIPFSLYANPCMLLSLPCLFDLIVVYMQSVCHIFWSLSICDAPVLCMHKLPISIPPYMLLLFCAHTICLLHVRISPCMSNLCWAPFAIDSYLICDHTLFAMSSLFLAFFAIISSMTCDQLYIYARATCSLPLWPLIHAHVWMLCHPASITTLCIRVRLSVDHTDFCDMPYTYPYDQCTTPFHVLATSYFMLGRSRPFFSLIWRDLFGCSVRFSIGYKQLTWKLLYSSRRKNLYFHPGISFSIVFFFFCIFLCFCLERLR